MGLDSRRSFARCSSLAASRPVASATAATSPTGTTNPYGRSKLMGEVDYDNAVTLRTSIIGHELASAHGLVGWFLSQTGPVRGFTKAEAQSPAPGPQGGAPLAPMFRMRQICAT